jgi:hypothetical protein
MAERNERDTKTLERGNIYFAYTPRVHSPGEETKVEGVEDIERTYMILSVQGQRRYRRIVVGRKRMPDVEQGRERFWGFVDIVGQRPEKVEDELEESTTIPLLEANECVPQLGRPERASTALLSTGIIII